MFDHNTLIISYDEKRGEPRMRGKKRREAGDPGDCIDCTLCVQVCPTGIDIRDGLQYECIACAACVDACDEVMEKSGMPKGLIRYTTENSLQGGQSKILRPRIFVYAAILLSLVAGFTLSFINRNAIELNVLHDRNSFYRVVDLSTIENVYTLKIMNKGTTPASYELSATGLDGLEVVSDVEDDMFNAAPGELIAIPIKIRAPKKVANQRIHNVELQVNDILNPGKDNSKSIKYFGYNK